MNNPKTTKFTLKRIVENMGQIPDRMQGEEKKLSQQQKQRLLELTSQFHQLGEAFAREEAILNSSKTMTELCELAETYALNECGDWFQKEIVAKDMANMKKRVMEFNKIAKECYAKMQQCAVAHDDVRHIMERYFDTKGAMPPTSKQPLENEVTIPNQPMR
jgi:hypothetical protein